MNGLMEILPEAERARARREDGWTGAAQAAFLRALADCGVVETAAKSVGLSAAGAYAFRRRPDGALFHLGWEGAVLLARRKLVDTLLARAIDGQVETITRGDDAARRHRHDNRLGCTMLGRLDRLCAADVEGEEAIAARMVAQDFERFVTMIEDGAGGVEAALFLEAARARHDARMSACFGADGVRNGHSQLNDPEPEEGDAEEADEGEDAQDPAADMSVWRNMDDEWVTNFPPPPGFDGDEQGRFGDDDYERELTEPELVCAFAREEEEMAGLVAAGEAARDAWFGFVPRRPRRARKVVRRAVPLPEPVMEIAGEASGEPQPRSAPVEEPEEENPNIRTVRPWPRPDHGLIPPWAVRIA